MCNDYFVDFHNDKTCFVSNGKLHILLLGNVEELLEKLDTFCFTYQHVDCLYTLFKYRFIGRLLQRVEKCLITCKKQLTLITQTREWTESQALQKRDFCGKSLKSIYSAPSKIPKRRKLVDQSLQKELKKLIRLNLSWI